MGAGSDAYAPREARGVGPPDFHGRRPVVVIGGAERQNTERQRSESLLTVEYPELLGERLDPVFFKMWCQSTSTVPGDNSIRRQPAQGLLRRRKDRSCDREQQAGIGRNLAASE